MPRNFGSFIWYGSTESKNRLVKIIQTPSGRYTLSVEKTDFEAPIVSTKEEVRKLLTAAQDIAFKDWGASEIDWPEVKD